MNLVIVDDDPAILRLLDIQLRPVGLPQSRFSSPAEALKAARVSAAEIGVIDYNLPGMDGIHLIEELRLLNPAFRAILITGQGISDAIEASLKAGVIQAVICKPWRVAELIECLRDVMAAAGAAAPPAPAPVPGSARPH